MEKRQDGKVHADMIFYSLITLHSHFKELSDKHFDYKGIGDYCDEGKVERLEALLDRFEKNGLLNEEERFFLYGMQQHYFDAFLAWLDETPNVKIVIE